MAFSNLKLIAGAAITLTACLVTVPGMARPLVQSGDLLSQINRPETEGVPQLTAEDVQGRVTKIDGDKVEVRLSSGELRTYTISSADQERNRLQVGSDILLTVRGDTVLAISPNTTTGAEQSGAAGSSSTSGSSSSSTSGSSSSTVRRQTTVQQTRPAPAPAPAASPAPQPQPVRGLW